MALLDKLIELIHSLWSDIKFWYVMSQYEAGVIVRLGKYKRNLNIGLNWKIPFVDEVHYTKSVPTTMPLRAQTLTTLDNKSIVVSSIVKYEIKNPKKFLLDIWDSTDVLRDTTMGAIKSVITSSNAADMKINEIEQRALDIVQGEVKPYGVKILRLTFIDIGAVRSIRLIGDPDEYED